MTDEWPETFLLIHQSHDQVYRTIDAAIHDEEQENPQSAIINYRLVIVQIDEAMTIPVQVPEDPVELDDTWRKACQMIHKMKCTRGEVVQRINSLMTKYPPPKLDITANAATAPLNESASDDQSRPRTYAELAIALQNIQSIEQRSDECLNDALQLIYTCNNVRFYRIGSNGDVTTTTENCELRVLSLEADTKRQLQNTYFMQIISEAITGSEATNAIDAFDNPWIYPLKAGASPCYYTKFGAFMFPDLHADDIEFGAAIGIVVPKESEHLVLEILEAILHGVVRQLTDADLALMRSRRSSSEVVSDNIVKGATYLSQGLVCGSNKIGQFMTNNTPYLISKLERVPENAPPVSERVVTGVQVAKNVTTAAVGVTGYVAGKIGSATMALGRFLAPHVHTQGSKLLSHTMGFSQEEAAEKMKDVLTVAAGAVEGFGTVYSGLEQSASVLGTSLSNNSVKVIEHKYGPSAGEVAAGTFDTVGNMINISHNVNYLTPKGLAKGTVKNAGRAMILDIVPKNKDARYVPAGSVYPQLGEFSKAVTKSSTTPN